MKILKRFIILAFILLIYGCSNSESAEFIEESGTIETIDITISSQLPGKISEVIKNEGNFVNQGDTLLIIETENSKLQLKQAEALKETAEAQLSLLLKGARKEDKATAEETLKQAQAQFDLAKKDKIRMENLYKLQSITKKQLEEVTVRYIIAESQLAAAKELLNKIENIARPEEIEQARANLKRAEAALNLTLKNYNDCFVISPIKGQIAKRFVSAGETVAPFSSLFKISELQTAELTVFVSERNLARVRPGQKAEITIDAFKDKIYVGRVKFISPEAEFTPKNIQTKDERTKLVFAVKIELPNPDYELKPGMPADAKIYFNAE